MNNRVTLSEYHDGFFSPPEVIELGSAESFQIDETNIEKELCTVGKELAFYGNLSAELKAQAATKRLALESFDAELALNIRNDPKEKITEGYIKEKIKANSMHKELTQEVIIAERDLNKVDNLFRSHTKRADCIIAISYKQRTEIKNY